MRIDFQTKPEDYRHWKIEVDGDVASLVMDVDEKGGLFDGYELKLNSYDLGVDIELNDAIQRLRFEHPEVKAVVLRSGNDRTFCAGANIRMLAGATHAHKVNFCKFTNETRNSIEDASENSGQKYICRINGTAAGGGYELALAADYIILSDDSSSSVALPEVPLLAVLPGTGGLTRVTDKAQGPARPCRCVLHHRRRHSRQAGGRLASGGRNRAELKNRGGNRSQRAREFADASSRPDAGPGVELTALDRTFGEDHVKYSTVTLEIDRDARIATVTITAPEEEVPGSAEEMLAQGAAFWPLRAARELDDAILHLRANEPEIAVLVMKTQGSPEAVMAYDTFLEANAEHWLGNEILHYWKRVLKRVDLTSRTLVAIIEPGSCFAGTLAELAFAADRSYMLIGGFEQDNRPDAVLQLNAHNFGRYPMSNGLSRLETRFFGEPESVAAVQARSGEALDAEEAEALGLVTFAFDDIDWEDEVRIFLEERASFSPDGLTGMEANLRFAGPETMETKIFGRLTAWQNWIFQRPNAVGEDGALRRYGTGRKPDYNRTRV